MTIAELEKERTKHAPGTTEYNRLSSKIFYQKHRRHFAYLRGPKCRAVDEAAIAEHYRHTVTEHPDFCRTFLTDDSRNNYALRLKATRAVADMVGSAESILDEELLEIYEAWLSGDMEHAKYECYDAIAVLLRMIQLIDERRKDEDRKRIAAVRLGKGERV